MGSSWASSPAARATMVANRARDTKPELALRRLLHAQGLRYRVDFRPVPAIRSRADVVFTRARLAVFVDGCFWHGCPEHYQASKTNSEYWKAKIEANKSRDAKTSRLLQEAGWSVVRVWEHEVAEQAVNRILRLLEGGPAAVSIAE